MTSKGNIFRVLEGVRRAKAFQLCGISIIRAQIVNADGTASAEIDVPIDDLRSPKIDIDISTPRNARRFWRIHNLVQAGGAARLPAIIITPGRQGTAIKDVRLRS